MNNPEQPISTSALVIGTGGSDPRAALGARRQAFRALHEGGCFVLPNPWDVGSARYLQHLGFPALATTSAGFAFSQGLPDSDVAVSRDRSLAHIAEIAAAVDLPSVRTSRRGMGSHRRKWQTASHDVWRPESQDCRSRMPPANGRRHSTNCRLRSSASRQRDKRSISRAATCY